MFASELTRIIPDLMVFAKVRTPNPMLAEDLVQETLARMLELDRRLGPSEIKPYAFTVLKNLIVDHYRAMPVSEFEDELIEDKSQFHVEVQKLLKGLKQLGENCQNVLTLAGLGHTQREISVELNTPIGTVGSWLARCREKLVEVIGL